MHQNGWGLPQSNEEAIRLYALAAEQGISEAMIAVGRFYLSDSDKWLNQLRVTASKNAVLAPKRMSPPIASKLASSCHLPVSVMSPYPNVVDVTTEKYSALLKSVNSPKV